MSEQRAPTSEEILIKSIINADLYSGHKRDKKKAPPVVATISPGAWRKSSASISTTRRSSTASPMQPVSTRI
jgi:hypothetical protein